MAIPFVHIEIEMNLQKNPGNIKIQNGGFIILHFHFCFCNN